MLKEDGLELVRNQKEGFKRMEIRGKEFTLGGGAKKLKVGIEISSVCFPILHVPRIPKT